MTYRTPQQIAVDWITNPKKCSRDITDVKDTAVDIINNTPARQVYTREIGKSLSRYGEDVSYNWRNFLSKATRGE